MLHVRCLCCAVVQLSCAVFCVLSWMLSGAARVLHFVTPTPCCAGLTPHPLRPNCPAYRNPDPCLPPACLHLPCVQQGLNLAAGQQLAVATGATVGRYVLIYTGMLSEGMLSLDDVQVYTYGAHCTV